MTLFEIQDRIAAMDSALIDKGYITPDCELNVTGSGDVDIWIKTGRDGDISGKFDNVSRASLEDAFDAADEMIAAYESVENHKKKEAVRQFGRAVDNLREVGFEAEFTDPLSERLQAMTENLLTHEAEREPEAPDAETIAAREESYRRAMNDAGRGHLLR